MDELLLFYKRLLYLKYQYTINCKYSLETKSKRCLRVLKIFKVCS